MVMAMAGGVILAAAWPDAGVFTIPAAASAATLSGVMSSRGHAGAARFYSLPECAGRNLLGFFQDSVARQLAQPVYPAPVQDEDDATGQRHLLRDGRVVKVVTRRRDLGAACRSEVNLVIALVAADYSCRCSPSPGCSGTISCCGWAGVDLSPVPYRVSISGSVR